MPEGMDALNAVLGGYSSPAPTSAPTPAPADSSAAPESTPSTTAAAPETAQDFPAGASADPTPAPVQPIEPKPAEPLDPEALFNGSKQNQAFAQMRVQNRQLTEVVSRLGNLLGMPPNAPPEQMIQTVQQKLIEAEAKAQNVPVELLQQIDQLRQSQLTQQRENLRAAAMIGFQRLKETFNLDDNRLTEFAQRLVSSGKNPYEAPVDLVQEYRMAYFDEILKAERDRAVQEALARSNKAAQHSTAPVQAVGKPADPAVPGNPMRALEGLLASYPGGSTRR